MLDEQPDFAGCRSNVKILEIESDKPDKSYSIETVIRAMKRRLQPLSRNDALLAVALVATAVLVFQVPFDSLLTIALTADAITSESFSGPHAARSGLWLYNTETPAGQSERRRC